MSTGLSTLDRPPQTTALASTRPIDGHDTARTADAFTRLYLSYQLRLARYLERVAPGRDVEALVQETFCRALRHIADLMTLPDPWPWLAVTARNLSRNITRIDRVTVTAGLDVRPGAAGPSVDPEEYAIVCDTIRAIGRVADTLSAPQRQLLVLIVTEQLPVAEAGRRLGIRDATARQHLHRLRARIHASIATEVR